MYVGLCMSCIDHGRNTRSEAREIASKLSREFDLNHIEIVLEGLGRRHAPYPWEWEESELREVEDFIEPFERKGAHLPFFSMNVIAANEGVREEAMKQMKMAIDIAKQLDLDYAVVHATGSTEGLATASEPRRMFLALSRYIGYCAGSNVTISLENAQNLRDIESCVEMMQSLQDQGLPIAMTFDTGHANFPLPNQQNPAFHSYGSVAGAIERCGDFINNIHLHNNDGASDQHRSISDGSIDLKTCIHTLRNMDFQGSISLEVGPNVDDLSREIETLQNWCEI
jgi:sugar phosphate isomerase/epimerase